MVAIESIALAAPPSEATAWQLERISFSSATDSGAVLTFHPRVNVVTVPTTDDVIPTVHLLQRALAAGGEGTHVEFIRAGGTPMVMFRPIAGRQRLIDVLAAQERPLTELYALIGTSPVPEVEDARAIVDTLSRADQFALWQAADRLLQARRALDDGGAVVTLGSATHGPAIDLRPKRGLLRRRTRAGEVGPADRRRTLEDAERAWTALAGPVPVDVAMLLKERCEAASRLLVRLGALATVSRSDDDTIPPPDRKGVLDAVDELVPLHGGDAGPHIVGVPGSADPELASLLLDSLVLTSADRQVIVVTADQQVIDWAKLENHANRAALVPFDTRRTG